MSEEPSRRDPRRVAGRDEMLSTELTAALSERVPAILDEVVEELRAEAPDYAAFLESQHEAVQEVADFALHRLVFLARRPAQERARPTEHVDRQAFERIGRTAWREGRPLGPMVSAYRSGARIAWRHISAVSVRRNLDTASLGALAEAIFVYVDELVDATVHGYAEEQAASAGERERRRLELADLLLSGRADQVMVAARAAGADWTVPDRVVVVMASSSRTESVTAPMVAGRLGPGALPVHRAGLVGAVVPDPDGPGRRARMAGSLRGLHAVVGETVSPDDLPAAYASASLALDLVGHGWLPDDDPLFVDDHLARLVVHRDHRLVDLVAARRLAPLAALPDTTQERLLETLRAWLDAMGDRQAAARVLHVHPQTVRYRLQQLRGLLGPALDDPQARFELALALRARDRYGPS